MALIQTKTVLDNVQTKVQNNSPAARAKLLVWYNEILKRLSNEFPWRCKLKSAAIAIAANALTLPTDFNEIDYVKVGSVYFTVEDEVTVNNAFMWAAGGTTPIGYLLSATALTFVPGTSATTCTFNYLQEVPTYTDAATDTIFEQKFQPVIERALLNSWYEYDVDPRANIYNVALDPAMLDALKVSELRNPDVARRYERWIKARTVPAQG